MSENSFGDSDDDESVDMDTSCVFSDYKENDGNVVQPFMYEPLASESSSDDSCSNTSGDGSDSSHEDSARLGNTDW